MLQFNELLVSAGANTGGVLIKLGSDYLGNYACGPMRFGCLFSLNILEMFVAAQVLAIIGLEVYPPGQGAWALSLPS